MNLETVPVDYRQVLNQHAMIIRERVKDVFMALRPDAQEIAFVLEVLLPCQERAYKLGLSDSSVTLSVNLDGKKGVLDWGAMENACASVELALVAIKADKLEIASQFIMDAYYFLTFPIGKSTAARAHSKRQVKSGSLGGLAKARKSENPLKDEALTRANSPPSEGWKTIEEAAGIISEALEQKNIESGGAVPPNGFFRRVLRWLSELPPGQKARLFPSVAKRSSRKG